MKPFLLSLLLASLLLPATAQQARGKPVIEPVANAAGEGSAGLFIGVNQFDDPGLSALRFAVNDAVAMAHRFSLDLGLLPARKTILCLGGRPTGPYVDQLAALKTAGASILDAKQGTILRQLRIVCAPDKTDADLLVIHASSHGFGLRTPGQTDRAVIMPSSGFEADADLTAIPLTRIKQLAAASKAGRQLIFLDACRANPVLGAKGNDGKTSAVFKGVVSTFKGAAVLLSCDSGQLSFEDPTLGLGVFTHFLLDGLGGAAPTDEGNQITLGTLVEYTEQGVRDWTRRQKGRDQTPMINKASFNFADMPLARATPAIDWDREVRATLAQLNKRTANDLSFSDFARATQLLEASQPDDTGLERLNAIKSYAAGGFPTAVFTGWLRSQQTQPVQPIQPGPPIAPATTIPQPPPPNLGRPAATGELIVTTDTPGFVSIKPGYWSDIKDRMHYRAQPPGPLTVIVEAGDATHKETVTIRPGQRTTVNATFPRAPKGFEGARPGETKRNHSGMALQWCPPGTFTMGSPDTEAGRDDDETQFKVTLTEGFWLARHEVTQGDWQAIMGRTLQQQADIAEADAKYVYEPDAKRPIYHVNHDEALEFCRKLTARERARGHLPPDWTYTLPTEAQWEYACRAGTPSATHPIYTGGITIRGLNNVPELDRIAWYGGNSSVGYTGKGSDTSGWSEKQYPGGLAGPRRVGQKQANAWGLHDMLGNVWEWTADWFGDYPSRPQTDYTGPADGVDRVYRGGSWRSLGKYCRAAYRFRRSPGSRDSHLGFRVAVVPSNPAK